MKDLLNRFKLGNHEFENGSLEGIEGVNPYDLFELWMHEAVDTKEKEPNAFSLSTVDAQNAPSSRVVYLKDILDGEFVLYTNYQSKKGKDIEFNPNVSMLFFWPISLRQIRVEGVCSKVATSISDDYFKSRPRRSQIGAWASSQSEDLVDRSDLEERIRLFENKFQKDVPRPDHWGGYQIKPKKFEFWQGRPSRLHDRFVFTLNGDSWKVNRVNP
jgi:pyridoxamine 5'-phosphate oxidase